MYYKKKGYLLKFYANIIKQNKKKLTDII